MHTVIGKNSNQETERTILRLRKNLERKNFTFEALFSLIEKLGTTLELDKIIRLLLMTLVGQLSISQISLYLYSPSGRRFLINHTLAVSQKVEREFFSFIPVRTGLAPRFRGSIVNYCQRGG